jgi:uncharacterized protein (DUF58 family)
VRRRYHLHLPGLLYFGLTLFVGLAAANRPNNLLVWVFGAMLAGVLISGIVSGAMLMGVRVLRGDPRRGVVGEPLVVRYAVSNRSRIWPVFNLLVEEMQPRRRDDLRGRSWSTSMRSAIGWVMHVGPGETVHGEIVFFPHERGRFVFERFRVSSTFPFGFLRKSIAFSQRTETLVHPRVLALREDLLAALVRGGLGGFRLSTTAGTGEDYFGVREYRPGDSVRQIAWKRMAAGQGVVSIERSSSTPPRIRVVLNLRTQTDSLRVAEGRIEPRRLEEDAISLAASIIALAERQGYEVGLSVLGIPEERVSQPRSPLRRGHWHVEKLMGTLASIELDGPRLADASLPEMDRDRAVVVAVHPDRAAPSIAPEGSWHFTATQMQSILAEGASAEGAPAKGAPAEGASTERRSPAAGGRRTEGRP